MPSAALNQEPAVGTDRKSALRVTVVELVAMKLVAELVASNWASPAKMTSLIAVPRVSAAAGPKVVANAVLVEVVTESEQR